MNQCANTGDPGAPCTTAAFYKDPWGVVHLKGNVRLPASGSSSIVFYLPVGYRSSGLARFRTWNSLDTTGS